MNSLTKGIEMVIKNAIEEYSGLIVSRFDNINTEDLEGIWNDICDDMKITVSFTSKQAPKKPSATEKTVSEKSSPGNGCPYLFTKGARQGEECGTPVKSGNTYCGKHKKYEGTEPKTKKILPKAGKVKSISTLSSTKKTSPVEKSTRKVFKINKTINRLVHEDTGLILKSATSRVVVNVFKDGQICKLTNADIDNCKLYGLEYEIEDEDDLSNKPETSEDEDRHDLSNNDETSEEENEKKKQEKKQEEFLDEEDDIEEEDEKIVVKKLSPEQLKKTKGNTKKSPQNPVKKNSLKNSVKDGINYTALQASDVEDILKELKLSNNSDGEESDFEEEYFEDEDDQ